MQDVGKNDFFESEMIAIAVILTISEDDIICNHLDSRSTDLANIRKNRIIPVFFIIIS